jgi:hypothetical protein
MNHGRRLGVTVFYCNFPLPKFVFISFIKKGPKVKAKIQAAFIFGAFSCISRLILRFAILLYAE